MTGEELANLAQDYYRSSNWRDLLIQDLAVNERTVRRWLSGQNPIPSWVGREWTGLVVMRAHDLSKAVLGLQDPTAGDRSIHTEEPHSKNANDKRRNH